MLLKGLCCARKGGGGNCSSFMEWNEALAVIGGTENIGWCRTLIRLVKVASGL